MRKPLTVLSVLVLTALAASAPAATFTIDRAHSNVGFVVKHMMVSNVHGSFKDFAGTFDYDPADPKSWKADVTIQATSIDTGTPKRDDHLRSADFFDVANLPTLTFKSTGVKPGAGDQFQLMGDLTMHGVTKPVVLDVTLNGTIKDMRGNTKIGLSATGRISRKDFGLLWNKSLETGGVLVGDEVSIALEVEATQNE